MASTTTTETTKLVGFENVTKGKVENNEWTGDGIFDILMYAANKNIEIQFNKGRIVGKEYAEAYTNVMNTIIAQAIQYYLQKDTQDAQTDDIRAGIALKENQLIIDNSKLKAELEKQWGYTVSEDATTGKLTLADDSGGKIDKEVLDIEAATDLKEHQLAADRNKVEAELEKQWGYGVTRNATTGELILGTSTGLGKIDKEILDTVANTDLKEQQKDTHYTEQVKLDKETAMIGLDGVVKHSETSRSTYTPTADKPVYVYTPKYIKEK
jgi:predicted transcriptional regulator